MPSTKERPPFASYKGKEPYIFISYAHKDSAAVFPELERMEAWGANIWYDEGIDPGNEWPTEIAAAVKNCAFFIYFVSPRSVASVNCRNEVHLALNHHKQFLSVHLEDTEIGTIDDGIELRIGSLQAILMYKMDLDSYERKLRYSLGKMVPANPSPGLPSIANRPLPAPIPLPSPISSEGSPVPLIAPPHTSLPPPPGQLPPPPTPFGTYTLPPPPVSLPPPGSMPRRGVSLDRGSSPAISPVTIIVILMVSLGLFFILIIGASIGWYVGVVKPRELADQDKQKKEQELNDLNQQEKKEGKGTIKIVAPETGTYEILKGDSLISKGTIPDSVFLVPASNYEVKVVDKDGAHLSLPISLNAGDSINVPDVNHLVDVANGSNDATDIFLVGFVYYEGWGTGQDYTKALEWYNKAADKNSPDAENCLGLMYRYGYGVDKDYSKALTNYQKAAEQNLPASQNSLGDLYYYGQGVTQDYQQSLKWYLKAAREDNTLGELNVAEMYYDGTGVTQDYATALTWFQKAADHGDASAENYIGYLYANGWGVTQDYSQALDWYKKSADQGYAAAEDNIGNLYQNGYGVKQDYNLALKWYQKSADQGDDVAQCNVGFMYENGYGVVQDYTAAFTWYKKSADQDYEVAQYNLGNLYVEGNGVDKDVNEAIKLWKKSAAKGDTDAQAQLKKYER